LPYNRICFTFSKPKGIARSAWNAVSRNRARRLGREAFRLMKNRACCGFDLILLVYSGAEIKNESLSDRIKQLESLFKKAGLLVY
jgi:ribonuclease P protein component